jgi:hypothetical protein
VLVAFFLLLGGSFVKAERNLRDAKKEKAALEGALQNSRPETQTLPDFMSHLQKNWEQTVTLEKSPGYESLYEAGKFSFEHQVPPEDQWMKDCENLTVEVDMEKISVKWDAPVLTEKKLTEINGYFLSRRWENRGKKDAKILEMKGVDTVSYEDTQIEPKVEYHYKVCAYTENKKAKGGVKMDSKGPEVILHSETKEKLESQKQKVADWIKELVVSKWTPEKKGAILPSFKLELLGLAGGDTAMLKLMKWEKGGWRSIPCMIKTGEKIKVSGYITGYPGKVEWDPGWRMVAINEREEVMKMKPLKKMVLDPKTTLPVQNPNGPGWLYQYTEEPYKDYTISIEYVDDKGDKVKLKKEEAQPKVKEGTPTDGKNK